jgi:hypothetical protein
VIFFVLNFLTGAIFDHLEVNGMFLIHIIIKNINFVAFLSAIIAVVIPVVVAVFGFFVIILKYLILNLIFLMIFNLGFLFNFYLVHL